MMDMHRELSELHLGGPGQQNRSDVDQDASSEKRNKKSPRRHGTKRRDNVSGSRSPRRRDKGANHGNTDDRGTGRRTEYSNTMEPLPPSLDYGMPADRVVASDPVVAAREREHRHHLATEYSPTEIARKSPGIRRKGKKPPGGGTMQLLDAHEGSGMSNASSRRSPKPGKRIVAKPDFDVGRQKQVVLEPLGFLEREPYKIGGIHSVIESVAPERNKPVAAPPKHIKAADHQVGWDSTHVKAKLLDDTALPHLEHEEVEIQTGENVREEERYISARDWAIMQKEASHREASITLPNSPPPMEIDDRGDEQTFEFGNGNSAFLTQVEDDDDVGHSLREGVETPKVLKLKPSFNPTDYIQRQKSRMIEEGHRRAALLAKGENPNTINMLKYKVREKPVFVVKPKPRKVWHTEEVKDMLNQMIRVENVKLRALDELLEDLTKGSRAGMMEERLAPLRQFIKGVRNRITYHREAKMQVMKQTWHAELKQLRVGGSMGLSLDQYLSIVSDMHMEDELVLVDDTP